jgi:hypothetical protein
MALLLTLAALILVGIISGLYAHWRQRPAIEPQGPALPDTSRPGRFFGEELAQDRDGGYPSGGGIGF